MTGDLAFLADGLVAALGSTDPLDDVDVIARDAIETAVFVLDDMFRYALARQLYFDPDRDDETTVALACTLAEAEPMILANVANLDDARLARLIERGLPPDAQGLSRRACILPRGGPLAAVYLPPLITLGETRCQARLRDLCALGPGEAATLAARTASAVAVEACRAGELAGEPLPALARSLLHWRPVTTDLLLRLIVRGNVDLATAIMATASVTGWKSVMDALYDDPDGPLAEIARNCGLPSSFVPVLQRAFSEALQRDPPAETADIPGHAAAMVEALVAWAADADVPAAIAWDIHALDDGQLFHASEVRPTAPIHREAQVIEFANHPALRQNRS